MAKDGILCHHKCSQDGRLATGSKFDPHFAFKSIFLFFLLQECRSTGVHSSFTQEICLLSAYYVPGTVLDDRKSVVSRCLRIYRKTVSAISGSLN